tara:strand:+ start:152 stop:403 length:252 start_codon:yes stop_codon:yes gene_type:complete
MAEEHTPDLESCSLSMPPINLEDLKYSPDEVLCAQMDCINKFLNQKVTEEVSIRWINIQHVDKNPERMCGYFLVGVNREKKTD